MEVLPADAAAPLRCHALALLGMSRSLRGATAEGADVLDEAARLLAEVDPISPAAQSISFALHGRLCAGQARELRRQVMTLESAAREAGGYGLLPYPLLVAADAAYRLGDWQAAERDISEAVASAELSAQRGPLSIALVVRGRLHAARGRTEAARADIAASVGIAEPAGYGATVLWAQAALGFLALGLGDADAAIDELEALEQLVEARQPRGPAHRAVGAGPRRGLLPRRPRGGRAEGRHAARAPGAAERHPARAGPDAGAWSPAAGSMRRSSVRASCTRMPLRRSKRPGRCWRGAGACTVRGGGSRPASGCATPTRASCGWGPSRGRRPPWPSCAPRAAGARGPPRNATS
jgi:tetratricopeptide (TPR) repeat protein